jgi:hypothetical protein
MRLLTKPTFIERAERVNSLQQSMSSLQDTRCYMMITTILYLRQKLPEKAAVHGPMNLFRVAELSLRRMPPDVCELTWHPARLSNSLS